MAQAGRPSGGAGRPPLGPLGLALHQMKVCFMLKQTICSFGGDTTKIDGGEMMEVICVVEWVPSVSCGSRLPVFLPYTHVYIYIYMDGF